MREREEPHCLRQHRQNGGRLVVPTSTTSAVGLFTLSRGHYSAPTATRDRGNEGRPVRLLTTPCRCILGMDTYRASIRPAKADCCLCCVRRTRRRGVHNQIVRGNATPIRETGPKSLKGAT